jgi:hypothetical protein
LIRPDKMDQVTQYRTHLECRPILVLTASNH